MTIGSVFTHKAVILIDQYLVAPSKALGTDPEGVFAVVESQYMFFDVSR